MADQRITQLTKLAQADIAATDVLPIVDIGSSITKKVEVKELFQAGAALADSASIDLIKLNQSSTTKLGTTALADDAITAAKLADDSSIAYDSVAPTVDNFEGRGYVNSTSKYLQVWDGSAFQQVVSPTAGIADLAVTTGKLADGAVTTAKVTALGTAAYADASITTAKLADGAVTAAKITDATITTAKIAAGGIAEAGIATDAITTGKILAAAVTADKLADDSSTIVQAGTPSGTGAFEGQQWFDTNTSVIYIWDSTAWIRQAAINTLTFTDTTPVAFAVAYPNQHSATITTTLDTQVANTAFLGPATGADAAPTFRAVTPDDLPNATASTRGIIQPGTGLSVSAGVLNHTNGATAGTFTKVTIDAQGHVSTGALIEAADVPSLDAAKITTGELPTARIADNAITSTKLADYATASIGEGLPAADFIGQIHLNPLDRAFFMWDGNVYVPIGISAGQIVLAGTFDASSPSGVGKVQSVTPDGAAAGFVVNDPLPASTSTNSKFYFVVSEGGTITSGNAPNVALTPPDIILSIYNETSPQWVEIDVSAGAGAIAATQVSFNPAASIAATNVQTALEEVSNECRNATNITSGTLAVARGGTNIASYTKGNILAASAATTLNALAVGTNGQVLRANSATATGLEWGNDFVGTVTTVTSSTGALTIATATTTPALTVRSATTSVDGIVQLSDSISTTSSVLAATPTAVKSAYDLAALALPKAGGTVTGDITLGVNIGIQFEGATDDANEIRLIGADATADQTITLPNATGTVALTSQLDDLVNVTGDLMTGALGIIAGTAAAPGLYSSGYTNTGIYSPGADQLALATGGVQRVNFNAATEVVFNDGGADVDFRIEGDTNPNLFKIDAGTDQVQVANLNGGPLAGFRNAIINGSFALAQRGTSFVAAANNDDSYNLDRWYVLSDGNDIVDITQNTATVPTNGKYAIALDVETVNKKFGIAQIIEADNCIGLIGGQVTLSFKARVSSTTNLDNVKAAIVAWSGTADTVTSDIVSAWNVEGTNPTLVANATYENAPVNLNLTTSYATYSVTASVDTASAKNIAVFIWSDVTTTSLAEFVYITDVQVEPGPVATPFERRPIGTELALCQRYFCKTFSIDTAPAQNTGLAGALHATSYTTGGLGATWKFPVEMRAAPTLSTFNPSAANSNWRDITNNADRTLLASTATGTTQTDIRAAASAAATAYNFIHSTASAEL